MLVQFNIHHNALPIVKSFTEIQHACEQQRIILKACAYYPVRNPFSSMELQAATLISISWVLHDNLASL